MSVSLSLRSEEKLKTDEISSVFSFGSHKHGIYLKILVLRNDGDSPRFAAVVGKRIVRRSVQRNYCKRVVRELFRLSRKNMAGWDIVIQVKRKFGNSQFKEVYKEYLTLSDSLNMDQ